MFKRVFSLVMALLLLSTHGAVLALGDVDGTRYSEAYAFLQDRGAVQGYADGSGRPYDALNRAEALKVILETQDKFKQRVEWYRGHMSDLPLFVDVRVDDWYNAYVEAGYEADILNGYSDRTFRPGNTLKVEEAIALLMRAYGRRNNEIGGPDWYTQYVDEAVAKNLIYGEERIYVGQNITRGQFFDMLYRLDTVESQQLVAFVDAIPPRPEPQPQPVAQPQQYVPSDPEPTPTGPVDERQYASTQAFAITIPRLGIKNLNISHPSDTLSSNGLLSVLKYGVGHLFAYPGQNGKIMVYGHSSSYSWDVSQFTKIFTKVNQLKTGDRVYVTYNGKLYVYAVTRQQTITPNDIRPFTGGGEELILFTCWPIGTSKSRLLVHASPVTTIALQ